MTRYDKALAAHQAAVQRGDTRGQHQTAKELQAAMTERLRREAIDREIERQSNNLGTFIQAVRKHFGGWS